MLFFFFQKEVKTKSTTKSRLVASTVHAAAVVVGLVVGAGGEVGVVVEGVATNVGVVVEERILDLPVVWSLAN